MNAEKEGKSVAQKYGVHGYPTILFLDGDGAIVGKIGGYEGPEAFSADMSKFVTSHKAYPGIAKALKANPKDGEANARMAAILAWRDDQAGAVKSLDNSVKAGYRGSHLGTAYNAVGDTYQNQGKFDEAIAYFNKAIASSKDIGTKGYAMISIMYCHVGKQDMTNARKVAKEILATKGMDPDFQNMAKQILGQGK